MKNLCKFIGIITFVAIIGFLMIACEDSDEDNSGKDEDNSSNKTPEDLPVTERWKKQVADDTDATIDYFSVDENGVCTVTIGGTAEPNSRDKWKARIVYPYTAMANTFYEYKFEAWTQSGNRELGLGYYWDDDIKSGFYSGVTLTTERKTYTVTGQMIPKSGVYIFEFQGADQLGTFYVKILSIEKTNTEPKTLVIGGIPKNLMNEMSDSTCYIGLFQSETNLGETINNLPRLLYGEDYDNTVAVTTSDDAAIINDTTVSFRLYDTKTGYQWTGSGAYVIGMFVDSNPRKIYWTGSTVNFTSPSTTIIYNPDWEIKSDGDFSHYYNGSTVSIIKYNGNEGTVTIPSIINGKLITSIETYAFLGCKSLTSVAIPEGVTSISWCAFLECTNLTSITIPASVTYIGWGALAQCNKLISITVAAGNTNYTSEDGILYNKAKTTLYAYPSASGTFTISSNVTTIYNFAFARNENTINSITIPVSVTSVGWRAFQGLTNQCTINVPWANGQRPAGWDSGWYTDCNAVIKYSVQ